MFIIFEQLATILVVLVVVTQLLFSILTNKPTFPLFRWKDKKAELDAVLREEEDARLADEIEKHKRNLSDIRKHTQESQPHDVSSATDEL